LGAGSKHGATGGVRIDDPKQLFCIRPAVEAFVDEQSSLVLLVRCERVASRSSDFCSRNRDASPSTGVLGHSRSLH
jgi:hypothetical protein